MNIKTPFCKFCADMGQDPKDHWLRATSNPQSRVTCPRLLATECRYCKEMGHTLSYCPVRKAKEARARNLRKRGLGEVNDEGYTAIIRTAPKPPVTISKESALMRSMFACLEIEEDDNETNVYVPVETVEDEAKTSKSYLEALQRTVDVSSKLKQGYSWKNWADMMEEDEE